MTTRQNVPADWFPDQQDPRLQRYWDGQRWTAHTREAIPAPPSAPTSAGLTDRWRALRLRTKVISIVGVLIVLIALVSNPDDRPSAFPSAAQTEDTSEPVESVDSEA